MQPTLSKLDHARFGVVTAKVVVEPGQSVAEALRQCDDLGAEFNIIRVPTHCHAQIAELERSGAFLADTLLYTRNDRISLSEITWPEGYSIREATADDARAVGAVARASFSGYDGHYHNDPKLRREDADETYASWAENCCINPNVADVVLIVEKQSEVVGFAALRTIDSVAFDGVLFGVDRAHRRLGLMARLLNASIAWGVERGFTAMEYSTHLTNVPALNAVTGRGFHFDRSMHTFHRWVGPHA
jgi:GNAT superfamily N-acetyltransferase